jgi:molybdenum cofactor cytidylyltransferase
MKSVGAIVLAAGGSSRLGQPKQFLVHEGETLVRRAVRAAIGAGCAPVVVVAGAESVRIEQETVGLAACVIHHSEWQRGIGTSIRAGLKQTLALEPKLTAVVIMVCDQPFVTDEVIAALLDRHAAEQMNVASAYAGTAGVPALFTRSFFPRLAALSDDRGARQLLAQWPHEVVCVAFPKGAIDIDTADDCRAHLGENAAPMRAGEASLG